MNEKSLPAGAKKILKSLAAQYSPLFVEKYKSLFCEIAQLEYDIDRLTVDINDEGDTKISEVTGNEYQSAKVCVRSQYQKQRNAAMKVLIAAETAYNKQNSHDSASGRKSKTAEEAAMGL